MSTGHLITKKALGSAACALLFGGIWWSGLNCDLSLSPSIQTSEQVKAQGPFLSEGIREPMPNMADGNDCIRCRSAPGPSAQSVGEKSKDILPSSAWYAHWHRPIDRFARLGIGFAQITTPVRIAFCRWLN